MVNDSERILHAIERIDDAIHLTSDVVVVLDTVIQEVREIFQSDRAWLFNPCNPDLSSFEVAFESTVPAYPGANALGDIVPMTGDMAGCCRRALSGNGEPEIDPPEGVEMNNDIAIRFGVKSRMFMALHPPSGDAWMFGLHQCEYQRVWTERDKRLFKLIGNRITNCIGNMLYVDQLRKSESTYRTLVDAAPFGIQMTDPEGKIVFSNPAHHRIQGCENSDLVGKYIWDLMVDDEHRDSARSYYESIIKDRPQPEVFYNRDRTRDGRLIDVQVDWDYVCGADGELEGIVSIINDVTERKEAERALERSESKYRQLIQTASDAVYLISEQGEFADVNDAACRMLNRRREDILECNISGIDPNFSVEAFLEFWKDTPLKQPVIFETGHLHNDGMIIPVEVSGQKFKIGEEIFFFGIARDITERKSSEEALRLSTQKYVSMVDNIGIGVALISSQMEVLEINKKMRQWFPELTPGPGTICYRAFNDPPRDRICDYCPTCKTIQDGKVHESVTETPVPGGICNYRIVSSPLVNDDGNVTAAIEMVEDITEQLKQEKQIRQSQKLESIGNLAGGIAHDFNNILASIIGFTELSLDEVEKGSTLEDNLQEVFSAGRRAKELVSQILAFARQSEERLSPVQVNSVVEEVLHFLRSTIPTTIEIESRVDSDSFIMGNQTQVHQILMNLCTNAADAMEEKGGILVVGLEDVMVGNDFFPETLDLSRGDYAKLTVSDTGEGIASEIVDSIFEPYFTTKGPGEGTGMGLAMVQGIIESYGGKITVYSVPGHGTTFTAYLPITRKRNASQYYEQEQLPAGEERILIVDDEEPIAKMVNKVLERLGYRATCKTSSVEALELFREHPDEFDLVITDMTMPGMTGAQLSMELMKIRPDIPIVLCTGYSSTISHERAEELGIKAFSYKPIVKAELAKTVRKVLDGVDVESGD